MVFPIDHLCEICKIFIYANYRKLYKYVIYTSVCKINILFFIVFTKFLLHKPNLYLNLHLLKFAFIIFLIFSTNYNIDFNNIGFKIK